MSEPELTPRQRQRRIERLRDMAKRWRARADSLESKGHRAGFVAQLRADAAAAEWAADEIDEAITRCSPTVADVTPAGVRSHG